MDNPTITTLDDDLVRTHDEALAVLRYAVLGADVRLEAVRDPGRTTTNASTRRYEIRLPRLSGALTSLDVYSLPIRAADLARHARGVADRAMTM